MKPIKQNTEIQQLLNAGATIRRDGRWWHGQHCLGFSTKEALTSLDALLRLERYFERYGTRHYRPVGLTRPASTIK